MLDHLVEQIEVREIMRAQLVRLHVYHELQTLIRVAAQQAAALRDLSDSSAQQVPRADIVSDQTD